MRVETFARAEPFADAALDYLVQDEANHTFLLNRIARGEHDPDRGPWWSAAVFDGTNLLGCATRDRQAVFVSLGPEAAWNALAEALRPCGWMRHVIGAWDPAHATIAALRRPAYVHVDLPLFKLTTAPDAGADAPGGRLVRADGSHAALLVEWSLAFHDEARLADARDRVPRQTRHRIELGELYVWLDDTGEPAGFAGGYLIPPGGARIAPVYTPPHRRRHGVARALVAALCDELRAQGASCIYLFTDAANPTSNAVYRRVGFTPCGRHAHLTFEPAP